jgi:hypothetical protein
MKVDKNELLVTMTIDQLDDLIYKVTANTNNRLFKGIYPYIQDLQDQQTIIIEQLDYIKACLQAKPRGRKKKVVDVNEALLL